MNQENQALETKLEIQLDDEMANGVYANLAVINHNEAEFVLDFVFVQPQAPRGKVRSRIVTAPIHAKGLLLALSENLRRYEQMHGPIDAGPKSPSAGPVPYN